MSKYNHIRNNFSSGEISPKSIGRSDIDEYKLACEELTNFTVKKSGGIFKRPGTVYFADAGICPGTKDPAIIPFIDSLGNTYVVVIDQNMLVEAVTHIVRIYNSSGVQQTITGSGYKARAFTGGLTGLGPSDPRFFTYVQVADTLFITHMEKRFCPMVIAKVGPSTFETSPYISNQTSGTFVDYTNDILRMPFLDVNVSPITLTPSATSGNITITSSAALFNVAHPGAIFKITHGATTGAARIKTYVSSTSVTATVIKNFGSAAASTEWEESAWSDYRGWPKTVSIFEESLYWGSNNILPDAVWKSKTGNFFHMMSRKFVQDQGASSDVSGLNYFGDDAETDPVTFQVAGDDVNDVWWLSPTRNLNVGTRSTEYVAGGGDSILGRGSVSFRPQTSYGASHSRVAKVNDEILFLADNRKELRTFGYSDQNGSNISINLSLLAGHIMAKNENVSGQFIDLFFCRPEDTVWLYNSELVTDQNSIIGLTYNREAKILAWHRHELGGNSDGFEIRGFIGAREKKYVLIKRTINSVDVYNIEEFWEEFERNTLAIPATVTARQKIPVYLDNSEIITLGAASDTLTGLSRLEGEEVAVTKNGVYIGLFTVSGGEIDLGVEYPIGTIFLVGYPYTARVIPTEIEAGGDFGTARGLLQRIDRVTVRLYNSFDGKLKWQGNNLFTDLFLGKTDIYSGSERVDLSADPDLRQTVEIYSTNPYPLNILYAAFRGNTYD